MCCVWGGHGDGDKPNSTLIESAAISIHGFSSFFIEEPLTV